MKREELQAIRERVDLYKRFGEKPWSLVKDGVIYDSEMNVVARFEPDHSAMYAFMCYENAPKLLDEIERLRGALEYIATFEHVSMKSCDINVKELGEVARQALEGDR